MTHRYTIGGAAFTTEKLLDELFTDGPADIEFTARFVDLDEFRVAVDTGALAVVGPGNLLGAIDTGEHRCRIVAEDPASADLGWLLRQLAPIFSAIAGRLVLHASAVEVNGAAIGFIGSTGVGKSTLATSMADAGHETISDDLLPIRFTPAPTTLGEDGPLPIVALFFLIRDPQDEVTIEELDLEASLTEHVENGFGEHRHADTWAMQFDAYHRLVEALPHFVLTIPDDLDALPRVVEAIVATMESVPVQSDGDA